MYIGQRLCLDLGSLSPVQIKVLSISNESVKVEYLYSTPGRTEEITLDEMRRLCSYDEYVATDRKLDKLRDAFIAGYNMGNSRNIYSQADLHINFNMWANENYDPLC